MKSLFALMIVMSLSLMAQNTSHTLPSVTLSGATGGYADGRSWKSTTLAGANRLIIYMDPDKRKNVTHLMNALSKNGSKNFTTVAIVNLAATWMPNRVLISKLNKQKGKMKRTEYVFDKKKVLVSKWYLPDDDTTVIVTNKAGKVLYQKSGKLSQLDVDTILKKLTNA